MARDTLEDIDDHLTRSLLHHYVWGDEPKDFEQIKVMLERRGVDHLKFNDHVTPLINEAISKAVADSKENNDADV